MPDQFPRTKSLPTQTPLFWVKQKDRYLRQILIRDIEGITKRPLVVYFADTAVQTSQIDQSDEKHLSEVLRSAGGKEFDVMIETNGGQTDASEAILSLLNKAAGSYRVIIPLRAKSAGTTISLGASEILMGISSELGPIDCQMSINGIGMVPASVLIGMASNPMNPNGQILAQMAQKGIDQTKIIATSALKQGMLKGEDDAKVSAVVDALTSGFPNHGAVVDSARATAIGLKSTYLPPGDPLWERVWLLRCMYEFDARATGCVKIFESRSASQSILAPPNPPKP